MKSYKQIREEYFAALKKFNDVELGPEEFDWIEILIIVGCLAAMLVCAAGVVLII